MQYTLTDQSIPEATVEWKSDYILKLTVTAANTASPSAFNFFIEKINNPYSQVQDNDVTIKHYPGCGTVPTDCKDSICSSPLVASYQYPDYANGQLSDVTIESFISPNSGIANNDANYIGSTDGNWHFSMNPGSEFPKYGGQIQMSVPIWFAGGTELVF